VQHRCPEGSEDPQDSDAQEAVRSLQGAARRAQARMDKRPPRSRTPSRTPLRRRIFLKPAERASPSSLPMRVAEAARKSPNARRMRVAEVARRSPFARRTRMPVAKAARRSRTAVRPPNRPEGEGEDEEGEDEEGA
jgi:hypothetical protein